MGGDLTERPVGGVGLGDHLQNPATTSAGVWTRGEVRPLPPTVLGVLVEKFKLTPIKTADEDLATILGA